MENSQQTDANRLSSLGKALAALAARMDPKNRASLAAYCARLLVEALENPKVTNARSLSNLGWALGALAKVMPAARQTQLLVLSDRLLAPVQSKDGREDPGDRNTIAGLCTLLSPQDLAEMVKWPFCVGDAEKIVLAEIEKQTGRTFGGDVWKFRQQAETLGIGNLDAPATRPRVEDALKELRTLRNGAQKKQ